MSTVLEREYPQRHPISVQEYLRMDETGVFAPEARLEPSVLRDPRASGYRTSFSAMGGKRIAVAMLPEAAIALSAIFPQ